MKPNAEQWARKGRQEAHKGHNKKHKKANALKFWIQ